MGSGGASDLSYVDLERESVYFDFNDFKSFNQGIVGNSFEPQYQKGGLDHNELAEIHAYRLSLDLTFEGEEDSAVFSLLPGVMQVRGGIGINMDNKDIPNGAGETADIPPGDAEGSGGTDMAIHIEDYEGLLQQFVMSAYAPYLDTDGDDTGPGPYAGGGSVSHSGDGFFCFPVDMDVRGPVLDENDEISCVVGLVKELAEGNDTLGDDLGVQFEGYAGLDLYYRIHTVEGSRTQFSLPP